MSPRNVLRSAGRHVTQRHPCVIRQHVPETLLDDLDRVPWADITGIFGRTATDNGELG